VTETAEHGFAVFEDKLLDARVSGRFLWVEIRLLTFDRIDDSSQKARAALRFSLGGSGGL
jgi:hypothetical protein